MSRDGEDPDPVPGGENAEPPPTVGEPPAGFLDRLDAERAADLLRGGDPERIGPYRIHGRVASGGQGDVYLAEDSRLERRVAIKLLPAWSGGDARARRRLLREARAAAALDHPNIQAVYEVGETDEGVPYLALAYYRGETLRDRLRRGRPAIDETLDVATQIAQGLSVAHDAGVLHRDLKPENVIITPGGVVKIIDFGISRVEGTGSGSTASTAGAEGVSGTVAYMSPEALEGRSGPTADLWALGVMMYEMLAGERPFTGETASALASAILVAEPPPLAGRRDDVPDALSVVVSRALEKDPGARYADADALLADLAGIRPAPARPGAGRVGPSKARGRRGLPATLAGVVVAAALAVGGYVTVHALRGDAVPAAATSMAILPFAPVSPDSGLARLGQEMAVLVSSGLDGVGDIRTVDALAVLSRNGGEPTPTPEAAADLARSLGAASLLRGTLVRVGGGVRIEAALLDAGSLERIARFGVEGPAGDPRTLADSLSLNLLREIWARGDAPLPSSGAITTRSLPALQAYLKGERALARAEFDVAVREFERAFARDSTFWYAYWRSLAPRVYEGSRPDSALLARLADHADEFPEPDRRLYAAGRAATLSDALAELHALTERFPNYWPGWYALADRRIHWAPFLGGELEDARAALERVIELHPGYADALRHLLWLDVFARDSAAARATLDRLRGFSTPGGIRINPSELRYDRVLVELTATRDSMTPAMLAEQAPFVATAAGPPSPISFATGLLDMDFPRAQTQLAEAVLELDPRAEMEAAQWLGRGLGRAARGGWDSAFVSLDRWVETTRAAVIDEAPDAPLVAYGFAVVASLLGEVPPGEAARRRDAARLAASGSADRRAELAWLDGVSAFTAGDNDGVRAARAAIPAGASFGEVLDRSLAAFGRALSGDTAGAGRDLAALELEGAERERQHLTGPLHPFLNSADRFAASRWLLAVGDTATASRLLTWTEAVFWNAQRFLDPVQRTLHTYALLARARVADARGESERAADLYRRFIRHYDLGGSAKLEEALGALRRLQGPTP